MRIAIVNLIMRTIRSTMRFPQFDGSLPRRDVEAMDPMAVMVADEIARLGHEVDIYSGSMFNVTRSPKSEETSLANVKYVREVMPGLFPPSYYPFTPSLIRQLRTGNYDAVLASEIMQPTIALTLLCRPAKIFIWQELGTHPRFPITIPGRIEFAFLRSEGFQRVSKFMPRSESARTYLTREGVPDEKISQVIPNGVDCRTFRPDQGSDFFEKRGMGGIPHPRVIMVSRIVRDKGVETFLAAAKILKDEGVNASFVLKGSGPDVDMVGPLVEKLGISDRVVRIEEYLSRPDLANLMASCDVCAAPSEGDLLFFVPLEAIASGLPVVVSNATHHVHTFSDGKAGRVIAPRNPRALANSLRELLADPNLRKRMSLAARQLAVEKFSIESVAGRILKEMSADGN
jgi:glycosyltransferase involved in cell wall biosynthesis